MLRLWFAAGLVIINSIMRFLKWIFSVTSCKRVFKTMISYSEKRLERVYDAAWKWGSRFYRTKLYRLYKIDTAKCDCKITASFNRSVYSTFYALLGDFKKGKIMPILHFLLKFKTTTAFAIVVRMIRRLM